MCGLIESAQFKKLPFVGLVEPAEYVNVVLYGQVLGAVSDKKQFTGYFSRVQFTFDVQDRGSTLAIPIGSDEQQANAPAKVRRFG